MVVQTKYVEVDREELRELREESAELARLRAQPARQVGGDEQLSNDEIHNIAYEIAVTDERGGYFFEAEDLDKFVAEIRAALAPAAVVMPEPVAWTWQGVIDELKGYCPDGVTVFPHEGPGVPIGLVRADEVVSLNRKPISAELLERIADNLESTSRHRPCTSQAHGLLTELRALLNKDEK